MWIEVHPVRSELRKPARAPRKGKLVSPVAFNLDHAISMHPDYKTERLVIVFQHDAVVCTENYYDFTANLDLIIEPPKPKTAGD